MTPFAFVGVFAAEDESTWPNTGGLLVFLIGIFPPKGLGGRAAPNGLGGRAAPNGLGGRAAPKGLGGRAAPKGLGGRAAPKGLGGRAAPKGLGGVGSLLSPIDSDPYQTFFNTVFLFVPSTVFDFIPS